MNRVMPMKFRFRPEVLPAIGTKERLGPRVSSLVGNEVRVTVEAFPAL